MGHGLKNILTVLWIGGMWIIGLLVTPILFAVLDQHSAGMAAGKIFHAIGWVGMAAGLYLLIYRIWQDGLRAFQTGPFWLLIGMLVCTLINQFAIFPIIAGIKTTLSQSAQGLFGGGFNSWHTISSSIYMVQSVFGLLYVWLMDNK